MKKDFTKVASREEIAENIISEANRLSKIADLLHATDYVMEKKLFNNFGFCMIPAAAKILNNENIWNWSVDYFLDIVKNSQPLRVFTGVEEYNKFLIAMKGMK